MNATISSFLMVAKQFGASDLHLTVGVRPKVRIRGTLQEIAVADRLMPADVKELVESMFKPRQKEIFDKYGEVDFAYAVPDIGRFRVNAFKQRGSYGAVLRLVGAEIPAPQTLGIPISVVELTKRKRGLVLVTGPTGSGKSTTLRTLSRWRTPSSTSTTTIRRSLTRERSALTPRAMPTAFALHFVKTRT